MIKQNVTRRRKYILIRIPSKYKEIFERDKDKIPQLIDRLFNENIQIQRIEDFNIYDVRVSLTVDELYYHKLEKLAKKYKMKISTLIRSLFFSSICSA